MPSSPAPNPISDAPAPPQNTPPVKVSEREQKHLLQQRDELVDKVASLKLTGKMIDEHQGDPAWDKAAREQQHQLEQANEQLNALLNDPRMEVVRARQARAAKEGHHDNRVGKALDGLGYLRTGANAVIKGADHVLKVVSSTSPALATASQAVSGVGSAVMVPLSVAQTAISAAQTANSVRHLWKDTGQRDVAQQARQEFSEDRKLAAIAKRIETKHGRNCIAHGFKAASSGIDTLGGAISTVGGTVTATVGLATGAATFGGTTAALATATTVASLSATVASVGVSAVGMGYDAGRSISSQMKKAEVNDAEKAIAKLKQAGYQRFEAKDGLQASKQRTNFVEQKLINVPLVGSGAQALAGGRSGGIQLSNDGPSPGLQRQERQEASVIDTLSDAPEAVRKPSVRERLGNAASSVGRGVSRVTDPVLDQAKRAGTFVADTASSVAKPVAQQAKRAGSFVAETASSVAKPIVNSSPVQAVAAVGGAAAKGVNQATTWASDKVKGAANEVKDAATSAATAVRDTVAEKTRPVRERVGNAVTNKLDSTFDIDKDKTFVKDAELKGLKAMQKHAVKHEMRDLEPRIKQTAKDRASEQIQAKYAHLPEGSDMKPKPSELKKEQKKLEEKIAKDLKAACKEELTQKYQDLDVLAEHVAETKIARDSMSAVRELAERLKEDCAPAFNQRGKTEVTAADLPEGSKAVDLARKLGIPDKEIARIVTDLSHQESQKIGEKNLAKNMKLR